jgi:hypothetical protein
MTERNWPLNAIAEETANGTGRPPNRHSDRTSQAQHPPDEATFTPPADTANVTRINILNVA